MSTKAGIKITEGGTLKRNERIALKLLFAILLFRILLDFGIRYEWGNGVYWIVAVMGLSALALAIWVVMSKRFTVLYKVIAVLLLILFTFSATLPLALLS